MRPLFTLLVTISIALPATVSGQPARLWEHLPQVPARPASEAWVHVAKAQAFKTTPALLRQFLAQAPNEQAAARKPLEIALPMPNGTLARFQVVESPVMAPELAARFPEIRTYIGKGIDDPAATARMDVSPAGFHGQILSPNGAVYIEPAFRKDSATHLSFYKRDYQKPADGFSCVVAAPDALLPQAIAPAALSRSGASLRTYRLACAATGEYTAYHGGTVADGMAAIVTAVNRVTGVYETELAIRLVLVANNDLLVFTNATTDPFTNDDGTKMLAENQTAVDSIIGPANYDIGHVFSTGGGGIAYLGVVCGSRYKAGGVTGLASPTGDAFYIDYVAHEMGHQFGANHCFNSVSSNCGGGNRNAATAYEPGSGSTIMSYAGICRPDDLQPHSDPYFHSISFDEILSYTTTGGGNGCAVLASTGNTEPTANAGSAFTIPQGTPFTLTGSGTDANGDTLTFCWEERDLGAAQLLTDPDNGSSPIFRSFNPTANPSRTFPQLATILGGPAVAGEKLPAINRTMNFRLTVRDNRPGGGGISTADTQVTVSASSGPFIVTSPDAPVTWSNQQTVTWNVAGTRTAPINADRVNILLSTDDGLTFPLMLASNVANNGSCLVGLPNVACPSARIKVQTVGNIFFNISTNFALVPFDAPPWIVADSIALMSETCTNGGIDPSELVTINVGLRNIGANATNIVATLRAAGGITLPSAPQSFGALAYGASATRPFSFVASGTCGGTIIAILDVSDDTTPLGQVTNLVRLGTVTTSSMAQTNVTQIKIPSSGSASPYPSTIAVSGISGAVTKAVVTLVNISHPNCGNIDVLLVGPSGQKVLLMSDTANGSSLSGATLTFDDLAAGPLPSTGQPISGTYTPTDYELGDTFPAPAPSGPYGTALSAFNGTSPNGNWSLYVVDDSTPNKGTISGWVLSLTTENVSCCSPTSSPPTISPIADQTVAEDTAVGPIAFVVADLETAPDALIVSAVSSNPVLVPAGNIVFGGSNPNRTVTITPAPNQYGTSTITVIVDDGTLTNTTAFLLTVNAVNDPPVLGAIADCTIDEETTLLITNSATDVDGMPGELTFGLGTNAPAGATIDPATGVLAWHPAESQGPSTNTVMVLVTDAGTPPLNDMKSFTIIVREINRAPTLGAPNNRVVYPGATVILTNTATDPDLPANVLHFSLASGPATSTVDPFSGVLSWTPSDSDLGTNSFSVAVRDNGVPPLADMKTFVVIVQSRPTISASIQGGNIALRWDAIAGQSYRVEFKNSLDELDWHELSTVTPAADTASAEDNLAVGARYYRVVTQ